MKNIYVTLLTLISFSVLAQDTTQGRFFVGQDIVEDYYLSTAEYNNQNITLNAVPSEGNEFVEWFFLEPSVLFGKNSNWKYLDNGSNLLDTWHTTSYDDESWNSGNGIFGYNNNNETTIINFGSDPLNKFVTTYFRKSFNIANSNSAKFLEISVLADDGVVGYVNGVEAFRYNMPDGEITYQSLASGNIPNETAYTKFTFPTLNLIDGTNTIAIELHQSSLGSSDLSFDATLSLLSSKNYTPPFNIIDNPVSFTADMDELIFPTFKAIPIDSTKFFLSLTEVMSSNDTTLLDLYGKSSDWIEVQNTSNQTISLNGFYLSDQLDLVNKWAFPDVNLGAGEFLIIHASKNESIGPQPHANFKISSSGEPILLSYNNELLETIPSTVLETDQSLIKVDGAWSVTNSPSPGEANSGGQSLVKFSQPAGLYPSSFNLGLSGNVNAQVIRYTLDGSLPTNTSPIFSDPILVEDRTLEDNGIANISSSAAWGAPSVDLLKGTVVKAAIFLAGEQVGPVETNSYLINEEFPTKYGFPVVSISMHPDSLFDFNDGLYVLGPNASAGHPHINANFWQGWEKECFIEFFEDDGTLAFEQSLGMKIHGGFSKGYPQKSFRITARDEYGSDRIYHKIFPDGEAVEFKSFILRNSGQDVDRSFIRDAVAQDVNQTEHQEMQAYRPSIVFINGVYWGIHNIRERLDDHHYSIKHDISRSSIDHLEIDGDIVSGDNQDYLDMITFMENNDLSVQSNFDFIAEQMDIENFTDYMTTEIYVNNLDWPHGNIKYWRSSELDNKWRWILYDLDPGMGGWAGTAEKNNLKRALSEDGNGKGAWATILLRSLMKNENYEAFFINRFLDRMNTGLKEEVVANRVEDYRALITPIISDHVDRWPTAITSVLAWKFGVNPIRTFGEKRPDYQRQHLIDCFELEDTTFTVSLQNTDSTKGYLKLSTLKIESSNYEGIYFKGVPVSLEAIPYPGYRFSHWVEASGEDAKLSLDLVLDTSLTAVFIIAPNTDFSSISLNEVHNKDSDAEIGTSAAKEWIELYNSSSTSLDLGGLFLTDNDNLTRWMFPLDLPSLTAIESQGYSVVCANDENPLSGLVAQLNSLKTGDTITLTKIVGTDTTILDQLIVPAKSKSNGRYPDGSDNTIVFHSPTFNASNILIDDCHGDENGEAILDSCGVCVEGNTGLVDDGCVVSVFSNHRISSLEIYPNPTYSKLHLSHEVDWSLFDLTGKLIDKGYSNFINLEGLPNGMYYLDSDRGHDKILKE